MSSINKTKLADDDIVLSAHNITKIYGGTIHALKGVDFNVKRGKVTALFGENGAGKSTLMKILSGVETPTFGDIKLNGKNITFPSASFARDCGISIIHQELSLAPNLCVCDNIFMGRELSTVTGVDFAEETRQTKKLMEILEEDIDPMTLVEDLRLGQQQLVEIARALSVNSKILIMDEPTSALSAAEVKVLFKVIRDLNSNGVSIVYISHHLEEALRITDYAVVLRDGKMTATEVSKNIDLKWIVQNMVGDDYDLGSPQSNVNRSKIKLSIDGVSVANSYDSTSSIVDNVSIDVCEGEIICLYGLMGAGRTELLETVAGSLNPSSGNVYLEGDNISQLSIAERIEKGLVLVPEDRQRDGLIQTMTIGHNLSIASIPEFSKLNVLLHKIESKLIAHAIDKINIKTQNKNNPIDSLSGGNQQKVVIGKMLSTNPKVILLDEPSRGIDVGAKAEIFSLLSKRANEGLSIIYSTSEVSECLSIAHRIIVLHKGKISAEFGSNATKEQIMASSGEVMIS